MENFADQFVENARKSYSLNETIQQLKLDSEGLNNQPIVNSTQSLSPYFDENSQNAKRIKELGFNIRHYEKNLPKNQFYGCTETFQCNFNDWSFEVKYFNDPDVPGGILLLNELKNTKSGETIKFNCDLLCNNTSKKRLDILLECLSIGYSEFIDKTYRHFMNLPNLLSNAGFMIEIENFSFNPLELKGHIKIDNVCYIHISRNSLDELQFVVTNNQNWDISTMESYYSKSDEINYPFNYTGEKDIQELISCIKAIKKHIKGEFGFEEFENSSELINSKKAKFRQGSEIQKIFFELQERINEHDNEKWQKRFVQIENNLYPNGQFNTGYSKKVNIYEGLEINEEFSLIFNDAEQWSIGDKINHSQICFQYNRETDNDSCVLKITNRIFGKQEKDELLQKNINEKTPFDIGLHEVKGSFSELKLILERFVYGMCKAHKIKF